VRFFRLTKRRYESTAFGGEGARVYPGRWNRKGTPMVYCASTLSLAVLECFVHVDPVDLPDDLVALHAELPDDAIATLDRARLPRTWRAVPAPRSLAELGEEWVKSRTSAGLLVPSAVLPSELNVLLNPAHPDILKLKRLGTEPFAFDPRMRK